MTNNMIVTWDDKAAAIALVHEIGMSAEEFTVHGDAIVQAFARHRTTPLAAQLDERIVHVSGTNPMSSETIQHLNVIANAACEAIHPAPSTSTPDEPASSIEFQQRRGRAADLIDWALNEYDGFMVDDDYDSQRLLDRIAERFRAFRHDNLETPHE